MPLASYVGSMARGNILNNTARTIRCLKLIFLLETEVVRKKCNDPLHEHDQGVRIISDRYFAFLGPHKNDCDSEFNSLKVLYRKQNVFTFEKCCEILNTSKNVEVI